MQHFFIKHDGLNNNIRSHMYKEKNTGNSKLKIFMHIKKQDSKHIQDQHKKNERQ